MFPVKNLPQNLRHKRLICVLLGVFTLALYLPSLRHTFLEYDDQQYVTENIHVRAGLTAAGLKWAFGYHVSNWHPLTWLSHMLDCQLYGLNPAGHHLTNALLHAASSVLLFLLLNRMTHALWRSFLVAALFAWHPLHVESVAWVSERKDVLSGFFFMLTLWAYAQYATSKEMAGEKPKPPNRNTRPVLFYILCLFCFALGLMSKAMLVTVPFVLLLLDAWPLKRMQTGLRVNLPLLVEKIPFLILTGIVSLLTISAQKESFSIVSTAGLPLFQRFAHALLSYVHYLRVTFVPAHLAVFYPYETEHGTGPLVLAGLLLAAITLVTVRFAKGFPFLLVGWLWFLGMLIPVIGFIQVGNQAWADRYTYLPLIGLFIALIWAVAEINKSFTASAAHDNLFAARILITLTLGVVLLTLSSRQLGVWKNTRTLFQHAADVIPDNYMAITVLGSLFAAEGQLEEAMDHYQQALRLKPNYPEAHFFLGNALDKKGKLDDAIAEYRQALRFKPMLEQTHILLGAALARKKNYSEAREHYLSALELNPESAVAHNNLARLYQTDGELDPAVIHYLAALRTDPGLSEAHNNLGVLYLQQGKLAEGVAHLREAVKLKPDNLQSKYNLALGLNRQEQWAEAESLFALTVPDSLSDARAHQQFALALAHNQKKREAMVEYARALLLQPDFSEALDGLSWILATSTTDELRNGAEAVRMAELACELTGKKDAAKLKTLAAAYAEVGRFPDAVTTVQQAKEAAKNMPGRVETPELQSMLESFQASKPWRE